MTATDVESGDDGDAVATRVVLSYPDDLSERTRDRIGQTYYRRYLGKLLDRPTAGDEFEEFTDVGCCGSQIHIAFRVESIDGGASVGPETEIEYEPRPVGDDDGTACAWSVQNEIDPP